MKQSWMQAAPCQCTSLSVAMQHCQAPCLPLFPPTRSCREDKVRCQCMCRSAELQHESRGVTLPHVCNLRVAWGTWIPAL